MHITVILGKKMTDVVLNVYKIEHHFSVFGLGDTIILWIILVHKGPL